MGPGRSVDCWSLRNGTWHIPLCWMKLSVAFKCCICNHPGWGCCSIIKKWCFEKFHKREQRLYIRSGGCAGAGGPRGTTAHSRSGGLAMGRIPSSKVRSSSCALLEQPWRDTHIQGKRNPSKTVGVARGHQRADTLKPYSQKTSQSNHTTTTALSNSMKLSHAVWGHPRRAGHCGEVW